MSDTGKHAAVIMRRRRLGARVQVLGESMGSVTQKAGTDGQRLGTSGAKNTSSERVCASSQNRAGNWGLARPMGRLSATRPPP